ncbi:MAG: hypothetical protein AB1405_01915 [Bdellovibrionota bacterium]
MDLEHPRKLIRNGAAAILRGALPDIGQRVFVTPFLMEERQDPYIMVFTKRGGASVHAKAPVIYARTVELVIGIVVPRVDIRKPEEDLEDYLDQLALQVEKVLFRDRTLGGACMPIELEGDADEHKRDGESMMMTRRVSFSATYITTVPAEEEFGTPQKFDQIHSEFEQPPADVNTDMKADKTGIYQAGA